MLKAIKISHITEKNLCEYTFPKIVGKEFVAN